MLTRPDLLSPNSPSGIEIVQLTTEAGVPSCHIYMEAQIFTPDSRRFLVHRSAHPHGSDLHDPEHRYLLCDLEDDCRLTPLTHETGATAPSFTPDGAWLYYVVNETEINGGRLLLRRVRVDGTERETVLVVDAPLPGTRFRPSRIYPLSTISSDARNLALSCFLGDGVATPAVWGLMVFDLVAASVRLIVQGPTWCNMHPQYCRAADPEWARRILIQENHDDTCDADGTVRHLAGGLGADIHLIRDDGTDFQDLPWGRDGEEFCQGHQCWRGGSTWAITSTGNRANTRRELIAGQAAPHSGHLGRRAPGAARNNLSRAFAEPQFAHFSTDHAGRRFVSDLLQNDGVWSVWLAELGASDADALRDWTFLADSRVRNKQAAHTHPFLSPDGRTAFFNSDETGTLQAYMIRNLPAPTAG